MIGRFLIAPSCFIAVGLEHTRSHHLDAAIPGDPETAIRGLGYWRYMIENFAATTREAFIGESQRLARKGQTLWSVNNRIIQGYAVSALLGICFYFVAGAVGLVAFIAIALVGTVTITVFSYIAHYGLVRVDGTRLEARHSWNSYRFFSTSLLFNLPRHSSHHLHADWPYWKLEHEPSAPLFPHGATVMASIALFPPLWRKVMAGPLEDWDRNYATNAELKLLKQLEN